MTIYSIAGELGISASTVSRAFSRPDLVKASVRDQVLSKAKEL
ncbi:LacI family DNA-binding transcriptional regulator [Sanguibacter sp. Z1732]